MRLTRQGPAVVIAAAIAMLLVACTSGGPAATSARTRASPTQVSPTQVSQNGPSTPSATPATESTLSCGDFIGTSARAAPLRVVLGVVALPASPGYGALGTALSGQGNGPLRLFAKTGLLIRPGSTFELIVPGGFTSRLAIAWGNPGTPSHRILVDNCASNAGGEWLAYAGGYWIDHPACVPIIVKAGGKQQEVHIGVGTACPGQRPPQEPSQS